MASFGFGSSTVMRLQAVLDADTRSFDAKMKASQTKTQKFGALAKTALVGGAAAGLYAVGKAAKIGWDEYNQGQQVAAQTNAVLKSTGAVAGVSAQHVEELGEALMLKSGIDDEVIKSGENVLLTFTKIRNEAGKGNDIFDQTTQVALDMSVALGQDLQGSMIQVGKAMQNPTIGLTALRRVGISFTDEQTEMIKKLDESGRTMEAQKMILQELTKEFGGSAEAAGKTFGGQINILRERLNNFLGDVVGKAIPYIQRFVKWIGPYAHNALVMTRKTVEQLQDAFARFTEILNEHRTTIDKVTRVLGILAQAVIFLWKWELKLYLALIDVWLKILDVTLKVTDKIIAAFQKVIHWGGNVKDVVVAIAKAVASFFQAIWNGYQRVIGPLNKLGDIFGGIKGALSGAAGAVSGFFGDGNIGVSLGSAAGAAGLSPTILDELGLAQAMGLTLTSGYRPGAVTSTGNPSLHGIGKAIDVAGSPASMSAFARVVAGRPGIREVLYTPVGGWYPGAGWTGLAGSLAADHYNHVHVGSYDQGGYLRPGWNLAYNGLGRPERVGGGDVNVYVGGSVLAERDLHTLIRRLDEDHRRRNG